MSVAETRAVADRIGATADDAVEQGREARVNLREVLQEVLGRDPFDS
jgi:hypothetical protein